MPHVDRKSLHHRRARLLALLTACLLLLQFTLGVGQLREAVGALFAPCCGSPCAGESAATSAEDAGPVSGEATHLDGDECPCPFDCALGCCSPSRALAGHFARLELGVASSQRLPRADGDRMPPSPDAPGILHVPKLAA